MGSLVFIDTNILLDFYRVTGKNASLGLLDIIDNNHKEIITTEQVEMEFKKNRQKVILQSLKEFNPELTKFIVPAFLSESAQIAAIEDRNKSIKVYSGKVKSRIERIFRDPSRNDQVYKIFQRLFKSKDAMNLKRPNKKRFDIRELAEKRFHLGYPPRKNDDTSMGDAINWEWIIDCAVKSTKNIIIVSRDSDYGVNYRGECALNDWLSCEFKERVSRKRKIILTDRLSEGFKTASIKVSKEIEQAEENSIENIKFEDLRNNLRIFLGEKDKMKSFRDAFLEENERLNSCIEAFKNQFDYTHYIETVKK